MTDQNVRNVFSKEGIEFSVPLTFEDETVGRATVHPNGDITCRFNFSGKGLKLRDLMTEGILDNLSVEDITTPALPSHAKEI